VGYGVRKKESVTGAISGVTSEDMERVHSSTVSGALAGKLAGVSFRQTDGRPGSGANVQIRNMGEPLFVIDGFQKDVGTFNNLSANDIESISILKDASASVYGSRGANGVVLVTTKRGKTNTKNTISVDAYTGWQNWSRFPKTVNAYQWLTGEADANFNQQSVNARTKAEFDPWLANYNLPNKQADLEKWRAGTEKGFQSFDWYDFIIKPNSPLNSVSINAQGGTDKINYYISGARLFQNSVLGREFTFERYNINSSIDAKNFQKVKSWNAGYVPY
jgi:TonB-dependent SusC/RagA subfamily outer membrane receptor